MRKVFLTKVFLSYTIRRSVRCALYSVHNEKEKKRQPANKNSYKDGCILEVSCFDVHRSSDGFFWHTLVKTFSLHVLAVFLLPSLLPSRWCLKCLCTLNSLFVEFDSLFSNSSRSMHAQLTKLFGIPMSAHTLTIEKLLNENNLWFVSSLTVAPFVGIFLFSAYKLYRFPQASFNWAMK